jgi:hypothetical protein
MAGSVDQSREDVEQRIISRAASDSAFRQQLLSDPRAALESELGVTLPASVKVNVLEESASEYYLVLPPASAAAGSELSDAELAGVAGGSGNSWNDTTCVNAGC